MKRLVFLLAMVSVMGFAATSHAQTTSPEVTYSWRASLLSGKQEVELDFGNLCTSGHFLLTRLELSPRGGSLGSWMGWAKIYQSAPGIIVDSRFTVHGAGVATASRTLSAGVRFGNKINIRLGAPAGPIGATFDIVFSGQCGTAPALPNTVGSTSS